MALTKVSGDILDNGVNVAGVVTATAFHGPVIGAITGTASTASFATTAYSLNGNVGDITADDITANDITNRNINSSGTITAVSFEGSGVNLTGVSGFGTALNNTQGTLGNLLYTTPTKFTVGAGLTSYVSSNDTAGNYVYTRLDEIIVGSGATVHIASNTEMVMDVLDLDASLTGGGGGTGGGITELLEDSTPKLGGNLDLNNKDISGTGDIDITGDITATSFSGVISGSTGTFSSDVTITGDLGVGGTITYEDVTSVDSVGIVTAREGIRIGAGKSIGSDGADAVYYGDGSNLNNLPGNPFTGSVGVQTGNITRTDLVGAGNSFVGMYLGDGFIGFPTHLGRSGGYYITTAVNALNAGPITLGSTMTLDGAWVIV